MKKQKESYSAGYSSEIINDFQKRTIYKEALFFQKYLNSNMKVLDCGCGPGSISMGIAEFLKDGYIILTDIKKGQLEIAKNEAKRRNLENIEYVQCDIYNLPFENSSFDAVFSHAVLQHLSNPQKAINEMYRVLKPHGVLGIRDDDADSLLIYPYTRRMKSIISYIKRLIPNNDGNPNIGKKYKEFLTRAGFKHIICTASCGYDSDSDSIHNRADVALKLIEKAGQEFQMSIEKVEKMKKDIKKWRDSPFSFSCITWCEGIGIK